MVDSVPTANPIRRRFRGNWYPAINSDGQSGPPKFRWDWVAVCPHCRAEVTANEWTWRATRKNTKDALYRHIQQEHRPGSVGR